jgi:hypothetical protein
MMTPYIFSYIKREVSRFETDEIQLGDNWNWNFRTHVQMIFHLKNGVFFTGENNWLRAFKNIMLPMLNLAYWTEDIEVKDVTFFIENKMGRALSFLIKKYHDEVYVRENDLDTLFDEITESDIDYGGVVVQDTNTGRPEVLPLITIAFCDQTNLLGGTIAFKHHFSPDKLRGMNKYGWGSEKNGATITLNDLILQATYEKDPVGTASTKKNKTPSKNIEVYILRGSMPEHYLEDNDNMEDCYNQVQIVAFYTNKDKKKEGVILYRKKEAEGTIKFHTSKKVDGRALGQGEGETLLHSQIWTNFLTIHKMNLLESASKVPLYTDDESYQNRNKIQDMENLEITTIEENKRIFQVPTAAPANIQLFQNGINEWMEHAQLTGSAFDPVLGKEANAGTTFRGQERVVAQGRGLHDRRRGQRVKFIESLYREIIIPKMVKEIVGGKKFLATLSPEEMTWVVDELATNAANNKIKESMFKGMREGKPMMTKEEQDTFKKVYKETFMKQGGKKLLEILADEFKDIEVRMGINIANKQKDLVNLSDKILSIFQYVFANPQGFQQAMQIPALARSFQDILEFSGLNQADFQALTAPMDAQPMMQAPQQQPQMTLNQPPVAA